MLHRLNIIVSVEETAHAAASATVDSQSVVGDDEVTESREPVQPATSNCVGEDQPPKKKQRLRGTNKKRPRDEKQPRSDILCPSIVQGDPSQCFYGSSCKFSHDIDAYMAKKPPDLGPNCPNFDRLGMCSYGVTCRFASAHLREDYRNVVDEGLWQSLPQPKTHNHLSPDLKFQLRKRQLLSPRADEYLKVLDASKKSGKSVREMVSYGMACSDKKSLAEVPLSTETLGCVTDEDQTRLRPCEKKKLDLRNKLFLAPLTTVGNIFSWKVTTILHISCGCCRLVICLSVVCASHLVLI